MVVTSRQKEDIRDLLTNAKCIVVVCHMTPDGDALGSSLCLFHTLRAMGRKIYVITPDTPPESLHFLPGC